MKLTFHLIIHASKYQVYFTRFADYHTAILVFFGNLFKVNSIIVVGGYDVKNIPEFKYGAYTNKFRSWCTKYSLRNAAHLLPNNETLIAETNTYSFKNPRNFGIKYIVPDTNAKIKVIHNGFDVKYWTSFNSSIERRKDYVLTVAEVDTMRTFRIKGLNEFIQAAESMKELTFIIVGFSYDLARRLNITLPDNLRLVEKVSQEELKSFYYQSKVFCLLSLTEGMPNVLCEAMLCKCIPVGSNINMIPEIIGDTGFVIKNKNIDEIIGAIKKAVNSHYTGQSARERIANNYSLERRESEIISFIKSLER